MKQEWHQNPWKWLNHLDEIKKGVNCEHRDHQQTEATSNTKNVLDGEHRNRGTRTLGGGSMKTLTLVLCCASLSWAKDCPKDHIDGPAGPCTAYMPRALGASPEEQQKWVSDEKPPKGKMPSYQREGIKAVDAPSMVDHDTKWDESVKREMSTVGKPTQTTTVAK